MGQTGAKCDAGALICPFLSFSTPVDVELKSSAKKSVSSTIYCKTFYPRLLVPKPNSKNFWSCVKCRIRRSVHCTRVTVKKMRREKSLAPTVGRLEKRYLLVQSPEKSYFSHLQKKYCLLKEKILGLYLGGAHHRAYYYCFGGTKKRMPLFPLLWCAPP